MIVKIVVTMFALFVLVKSYDEYRSRREPWPVFLFWMAVWAAVLMFAYFPRIADWLQVHALGPQAGLGTVIGVAIVFLLFLSYRIYLKAERLEQDLNQLTSDIALHEHARDVQNKKQRAKS